MTKQHTEMTKQDKQDNEDVDCVMCHLYPNTQKQSKILWSIIIKLYEYYLQHCAHVVESLLIVEFVLCQVLHNSSGSYYSQPEGTVATSYSKNGHTSQLRLNCPCILTIFYSTVVYTVCTWV